jgi:hypothetical protein
MAQNNELVLKKESKPTPESFIVRGRVVTNAGVAAKGLKVIAVDKSPGKDVVLGETITDSSGTYTISYKKEALQKLGKQKADIEIRILDPEEESNTFRRAQAKNIIVSLDDFTRSVVDEAGQYSERLLEYQEYVEIRQGYDKYCEVINIS